MKHSCQPHVPLRLGVFTQHTRMHEIGVLAKCKIIILGDEMIPQ